MEPLFSPDMHVFYEHTSIPLAVYYTKNNGFKAYLASEGFARMYETTPEALVDRLNSSDPFANIIEKNEMAEAVRAFSDSDEPYNVVFHEAIGPDKKIKTVHAIGTHEFTRDGRRYSLIRYDEISDTSRHFLFRDEEKAIEKERQFLARIDDAIARSYTSVAYLDIAEDLVHPVRLNRFGQFVWEDVGQRRNLRDSIDVYTRSLVYKDDAEGVLKFGDISWVMEQLKENNPLYHVYRTIRNGKIVYYRLKVIPFDGGKKLIYGFEHFDEQIREQIARKSEHDTQMTLLAGLSCEYESVWLVDAAIHHARMISTRIRPAKDTDRSHPVREGNYDTIIGNYIDNFVVAEDRERLYQLSSIESLMRSTKEDEIYHINYCRINDEGSRNYIQLAIARVTDEMGVVRFVCGFRNIDAIIEEEKNRNLLYNMAHMDNMTNVNNRKTFVEYMDSIDPEEIKEEFIFFSFDLNDLKDVNDSLGHEAGDELIKGAANCMKEVLGKYGSVYRTGGDEFAALANIPHDIRADVIRRLKDRFEGWHGEYSQKLSISMGYVSASEDPSMTIEEMRREADKRMYAQKSDYYMQEGNDRRRNRHH
ncbi:MAG: GGDEF domain-containing protein [Lachnospiraceae bacterium]|nr:GGDEF domain-containing protein [Lachnospiraceae bacterium]